MLLYVTIALIAINVWTFLAYASDKRRAVKGARRIPERHLLQLAALGGSPAALLARRMLRHKTRKEPFGTRLLLIAVVQLGLMIGLLLAGPGGLA